MQKQLRTVALFVALLATGVPVRAATQNTDVSGTWQITMESPRGSRNATLVLEQDGAKLNGTWQAQQGRKQEVTGKVDGAKIEFSFSARSRNNGTRTLKFEGKIEGDKLAGTADFGRFQMKWTGQRHQEG